MDITEIIEGLKNIAGYAVHTVGEEPFVMSLDDGIAVHEAIELLEKAETNRPEIPDSCNAETVEAIPVDWIQRYINACEMVSVMDGGAVTKWSADAVKAMLECWREEQLPTCGPDYCEIGEIHD